MEECGKDAGSMLHGRPLARRVHHVPWLGTQLNAMFFPAMNHTIGPMIGKQKHTTIQISFPAPVSMSELRIDSRARMNSASGTATARMHRMVNTIPVMTMPSSVLAQAPWSMPVAS